MRQKFSRRPGYVLAACCLGLSMRSAWAQDGPLGLYAGGGLGTATIRQGPELSTGYYALVRDDFGWDAFIGVRPLPYVGAEIGYVDFGSVHSSSSQFRPGASLSSVFDHASANAPTAFLVGYLPLAVSGLDLYGKAGVARLRKSWDVDSTFSSEEPPIIGVANYSGTSTEWDFAYGVGTQCTFGALALRLEYERVSAPGGNPDLLSVGVSWTFF